MTILSNFSDFLWYVNSSIRLIFFSPIFLVISTALVLQGEIIRDFGPINFSEIFVDSKYTELRTHDSFLISSDDNSFVIFTAKTFNLGSPKNNIIMEY